MANIPADALAMLIGAGGALLFFAVLLFLGWLDELKNTPGDID